MNLKLIDHIGNEQRVVSSPIGLDALKSSWKFSTDFPVAVDRGISTENLKFYKTDRDFLLEIFYRDGTNAVVDLEYNSDNLSFVVVLDFTTSTWDDVFFEVGYKFSRLADKIKELDDTGKIEIERADTLEYQMNTRVQSVAAQTEIKNFEPGENFFGFTKTTISGSKKLVSWVEAINMIGLPRVPGVEIGREIGTELNNPNPFTPIVVGSTTCELYFATYYNAIFSWTPADAPDSFSIAHIKGKWNMEFVTDNNASSVTMYFMFRVMAYYRKTGSPSVWRYADLDHITFSAAGSGSDNTMIVTLDHDISLPDTLSHTYNGVTYDSVEVHLVFYPYETADLATGTALEQVVRLSSLLVSGVEITHSLTQYNHNVFVLPVNRYFDKLGLFDNQCRQYLEGALLASKKSFHGALTLNVKPSEVMHDVSLLYAVKFVEHEGKYVIMRIETPSSTIEEVRHSDELAYTAIPNYTGFRIKVRETGSDDVQYPEKIFAGTAKIDDTRFGGSILDIDTNLTTNGGDILRDIMTGEGTTTYLMHAYDISSRQLTPQSIGRQINEYYMFREVVSRLLPLLGSWLRPLQQLNITDCDSFYNPTTNTGSTDPLLPVPPLYSNYTISARIPVTFELMRAILNGCKRLKINGLNIALKEIEINTEPNIAEISGLIELY